MLNSSALPGSLTWVTVLLLLNAWDAACFLFISAGAHVIVSMAGDESTNSSSRLAAVRPWKVISPSSFTATGRPVDSVNAVCVISPVTSCHGGGIPGDPEAFSDDRHDGVVM